MMLFPKEIFSIEAASFLFDDATLIPPNLCFEAGDILDNFLSQIAYPMHLSNYPFSIIV